ncbi:hypothetical protein CBOM_07416 [Ceraceosorus bombacis]|uniref:Uncharacterized protein n=1 Tax=Ceraceosorus bombacis TaxID=401625 RepID=A0A0P1BBB5_9BASI|nr:hypothetical protein CBOM_07416 [Ceraceosorus bombacis]
MERVETERQASAGRGHSLLAKLRASVVVTCPTTSAGKGNGQQEERPRVDLVSSPHGLALFLRMPWGQLEATRCDQNDAGERRGE